MATIDQEALGRDRRVVRDALAVLEARGLRLFSLPTATPELDAIEPVFRAINHTHLPERRSTSQAAPHHTVAAAFAEYEQELIAQTAPQPGRTA